MHLYPSTVRHRLASMVQSPSATLIIDIITNIILYHIMTTVTTIILYLCIYIYIYY